MRRTTWCGPSTAGRWRTAALAREESPPEGKKPVEWLLLTNEAVETLDEACLRVAWCRIPWQDELFIKWNRQHLRIKCELSALRQDIPHEHCGCQPSEDVDQKPLVGAHLAGNLDAGFFLDPVKQGVGREDAVAIRQALKSGNAEKWLDNLREGGTARMIKLDKYANKFGNWTEF
jgi:hypothetical protein